MPPRFAAATLSVVLLGSLYSAALAASPNHHAYKPAGPDPRLVERCMAETTRLENLLKTISRLHVEEAIASETVPHAFYETKEKAIMVEAELSRHNLEADKCPQGAPVLDRDYYQHDAVQCFAARVRAVEARPRETAAPVECDEARWRRDGASVGG